ncbi:hypothetical protein Agabi119p4_5832 [Agaricus bisporus var. burnettii]|uniref:Uncharacterized protein n=1 Tax=Agaricus bisporus var. burnettii TaxID=192524 RepID=A0A8H7KGJ3_AGABI|nr:hypothetical protein Agabi119p4_5832 [Agaricus bisporus var. burnettii]
MAITFSFENIPPLPIRSSPSFPGAHAEDNVVGIDNEDLQSSRSSSLDPYAVPPGPSILRKRRASTPNSELEEDLGQTVTDFLRHHKMAKTTEAEFTATANMSHAEREVRMLGHLMVIEDLLTGKLAGEGDNNGESQVAIFGGSISGAGKMPPEDMKGFIDKETFVILVKPDVTRYTDKDADRDKTGNSESILEKGPKDTIWNAVMVTPNIGYKPSMSQNTISRQAIKSYIGTKLNQRRYAIKQKIEESLGTLFSPTFIIVPNIPPLDIMRLTQNILNILKSARVPLTYGRVCRVAFLRNAFRMFREEKMPNYWTVVDQQLHQGRKHTRSEQKRYFHMIFLKDMETYGKPDPIRLMELLKTCTADDVEHGCDVLE